MTDTANREPTNDGEKRDEHDEIIDGDDIADKDRPHVVDSGEPGRYRPGTPLMPDESGISKQEDNPD